MTDEGGSKNSSSLRVHPASSSRPLVRVFCAVELPVEVRERIAEAIARLREAAPGVRASWERTEKLHITLKFLGEIAPERVEALSNAAERTSKLSPPFTLKVEGAGAFPPRGLPRVLWLGIVDLQGALIRLQKSLEDECVAEGFAREERPFRPHLTLARIRAPQGARELAKLHQENNFEPVEFPVSDLTVLRSDLSPRGSRYTEISRHDL
jgi:2'-5' RNA ligase